MPLFGSKKKKRRRAENSLDLETALSEGRVGLLEGGDLEQDGLAHELFHIGALMTGTSGAELDKLEKALFGRTFKDLLREGYRPAVVIKDDNGIEWTAMGKIGQ